MVLLALRLALGCAVHTQGVLLAQDDSVLLLTDSGQHTLILEQDMRQLQALGQCTVELDAQRRVGGLLVQDYSVIAAQDGTTPFVGALRPDGDRLVLIERRSAMRLILVGPVSDELWQYAGQSVLVYGYANGPHEFMVMGYTVLTPG